MWTDSFDSGVMLADYHVIRRRKLKLNDLYTGDSSSIYWFNKGVNWRAIVAFISGVWPLLRECPSVLYLVHVLTIISFLAGLDGKVNSIEDSSMVGWIRLYNLTFIVGIAMSFSVFCALSLAWPPSGLGEEAPFVDDEVIYGVAEESLDDGKEGLRKDTDKDGMARAVAV